MTLTAQQIIEKAENDVLDIFHQIDKTELVNTKRVLEAFQNERIASHHFSQSNALSNASLPISS